MYKGGNLENWLPMWGIKPILQSLIGGSDKFCSDTTKSYLHICQVINNDQSPPSFPRIICHSVCITIINEEPYAEESTLSTSFEKWRMFCRQSSRFDMRGFSWIQWKIIKELAFSNFDQIQQTKSHLFLSFLFIITQ